MSKIKKEKIETYYVTHTITIVQSVPARNADEAEKRYVAMMKNRDARAALAKKGITSTSNTEWSIVVRAGLEQSYADTTITHDMVDAWLGESDDPRDILTEVVNKDYDLEQLRDDIISTWA